MDAHLPPSPEPTDTSARATPPSLAILFEYWQRFFLVQRDPDELADHILEALVRETAASSGSLMLLGEDHALRIAAARGLPPEIVRGVSVRSGEGIAGHVLQSRRALMLPDGPDVPAEILRLLSREYIVSALCVPLIVDDVILGVLNLSRRRGSAPFTLDDLWFTSLLADGVAKSLLIARLYSRIERRERHLARVTKYASDLIVSTDAEGRVSGWNPACERATGLGLGQVRDHPLPLLFAAEDQTCVAEALEAVIAGIGAVHVEAKLSDARGERHVSIAWNLVPVAADDGKLVGIVAVGRDLTDQRKLEAQLIQSARVASVGVMAGGIAHELRNPLGIISATAQLLARDTSDAAFVAVCATKIQAATERAVRSIEGMLQFARPVEGSIIVDLNAVVLSTLALLNHELVTRRVRLRQALHPEPLLISARPELIQQLLVNLILNAFNAMARCPSLAVVTSAGPHGSAEVRVEDNGHGIAPEHISAIFDPFSTTVPVGTGAGLGLAISHNIVRQHGGTIEVERTPGAGATFIVRFPLVSECEQNP
ncbi:MAG: hypothetical protein RLZZ387_1103 [Chloroflexota bacterium]